MQDRKLDQPPRYLRSAPVRLAPDGVDIEGRSIRGFGVIRRGLVRGWREWVDDTFMEQLVAAEQQQRAAGRNGFKMRFTHPSLSGDGLGTALGRATDLRIVDGVVRADAQMFEAADESPKGRLASYTLKLAQEAPDMFGASIVYMPDHVAEEAFVEQHSVEFEDVIDGKTVKRRKFVSPDPENVEGLPHARLSGDDLRAIDFVDTPAATDGVFSDGQEIAQRADAMASYALGITDEIPEHAFEELDPQRVRGFVERFLAAHELKVVSTSDDQVATLEGRVEALERQLADVAQERDAARADIATRKRQDIADIVAQARRCASATNDPVALRAQFELVERAAASGDLEMARAQFAAMESVARLLTPGRLTESRDGRRPGSEDARERGRRIAREARPKRKQKEQS